jgi:hypothetical protein
MSADDWRGMQCIPLIRYALPLIRYAIPLIRYAMHSVCNALGDEARCAMLGLRWWE